MDAYETRKRDWENLEVTREELKNLTECLKQEEFRKLLIEYAEEVTDPENRKTYEKEIIQLEKERGVDVTFVNPEPGYVIKTSVNGEKKCFLNISKSDIVGRPSSQPSFEQGHRGLQWSIPYTLVPPRDDLDKKNVRCVVFDVVFHPDTIYLTSKNARFRDIVNNTAMDGIENSFKVKLDRKNIKFPKMTYKGVCQPTVIRKPSTEPVKEQLDIEPEIYQKLISSYDESREQQSKRFEESTRAPPPTTYYKDKQPKAKDTEDYVTPKFSIKHRSDIDLADFGVTKDAKIHAAIPKKLIITVDLPLLRSATDATLDIQERALSLRSEKPAKYSLELPLPYSVDADLGNAKFDPKYKKLTVTLPVIPPAIPIMDTREDSGVDSDHSSPVPHLSDEPVTDSSTSKESNSGVAHLVEECETQLEGTTLSKDCELPEECCDTALRTSGTETTDTFMNPSIKYSLPAFTCNIYDNQLAVTVNVKNVDPESIHPRILRNNLGLHVLLTSIGAGFFPQYYSLCLKIREDSVDPDSLTIDPWDNNVVFTIALKNSRNLSRYFVGLTEEWVEEKELATSASFKNQQKELLPVQETDPEQDRNVVEGNNMIVNVRPNSLDSDDETDQQDTRSTVRRQNRRHSMTKARSVSESSGDELASNGSSTGGFSKGILKSRRGHGFSRSVSESSADENGMPASSVDCHYDSIQDFNSESDCSSLKKTVRFNDVVSRQLFRSNSSILGQRKKNQRKLRNKKRAHERRMSESENSETEERDKYRTNQKNASRQEAAEAVKPILSREKQLQEQRTANIEIEKAKASNESSSHKRKSSVEEDVSDNVHTTSASEVAKNVAKAEFKNDLIFDLDM